MNENYIILIIVICGVIAFAILWYLIKGLEKNKKVRRKKK